MSLIRLIDQLLVIYVYIIIIRAVMSWFSPSYDNPIYRFVISLTEPILSRIRRILPSLGGLDLSPIVLIFLIGLLRNFLFRI